MPLRLQIVFNVVVVLLVRVSGVAFVAVHGGFEILQILVDALNEVVQLRQIVAQVAQFARRCLPARRPAPRAIWRWGNPRQAPCCRSIRECSRSVLSALPCFYLRPTGQLRYRKWGGKARRPQSADKAHNRKNRSDIHKSEAILLPSSARMPPAVTYVLVSSLGGMRASLGGFVEPFGIVKSSRKVASPKACKSPTATVFDDPRSAKTPRRQILPPAKFPRLRAFSTLCRLH